MTNGTSRRDFLRTATVGAATTAALGKGAAAGAAGPRKPNLLFLWTDEQRADTMAAYGNTRIHAPNLNRLASESCVFERAYVTQPVCTPSRSTVMTGLWPHTNGCTTNNIPLPEDTPCLPELAGDPEYHAAYMGKWHLGDEVFAQHGFHEWVSIEDMYAKHYRPSRNRETRSSYHQFLLEKGHEPNVRGQFSRDFAARRPIEHCKPRFLEEQACDFLRRNQDNPFMLVVNFLEPHMPFFGPLDDEHDLDEVTMPGNFDDPLEDNEPLRYRVLREYARERYGATEAEIHQLIRRYWGLVTQVDRSVGGILDTLDELGLADDTIVVYTSDHGDMMGSHGLVAKCVMYEEAVRVPWLMRVPWLSGEQRTIPQPVSHIDLIPTLLELMNASVPPALRGQSLVPLLHGREVDQDHVFIEWSPGAGAGKRSDDTTALASEEEIRYVAEENTRTVISPDGWKLCLSDRDKCQLFNLNQDPGETTNLFDSGKHDDRIARLTERIRQWQRKSGDSLELS